jgi:hypothetical protein
MFINFPIIQLQNPTQLPPRRRCFGGSASPALRASDALLPSVVLTAVQRWDPRQILEARSKGKQLIISMGISGS